MSYRVFFLEYENSEFTYLVNELPSILFGIRANEYDERTAREGGFLLGELWKRVFLVIYVYEKRLYKNLVENRGIMEKVL
jgi:hypothetical protein